jgi:hypothetical protein
MAIALSWPYCSIILNWNAVWMAITNGILSAVMAPSTTTSNALSNAVAFDGATFLGVRRTGALLSASGGDALPLLVVFPWRWNHVCRDVSDRVGLVCRPVLALPPALYTKNNMPSTQTGGPPTSRNRTCRIVQDGVGELVSFVLNINVLAVRLYLPHIPRVALRTHELRLHILPPPLFPVSEIATLSQGMSATCLIAFFFGVSGTFSKSIETVSVSASASSALNHVKSLYVIIPGGGYCTRSRISRRTCPCCDKY